MMFQFILACAALNVVAASIAGYDPLHNVTQHLRLDLDQANLNAAVSASNLTLAYKWYSTGGNSIKVDGSTRTLAGFSSNKLLGEKWYDIYVAYWAGNQQYADAYTSSACKGTGDFAARAASSSGPAITSISQGEGCQKGSQYQNVWMYVIHELEAAITDCNNGVTDGTHWDEAVAFYSGSMILTAPTTNIGVFQYGLAEKRCAGFNTCTASDSNALLYRSAVNENVYALFASGRDMQASLRCSAMSVVKESLVQQFSVPLVQGVLRYIYLAKTQNLEKLRAELWSFSAALLPLLDYYSPAAASTLYSNTYIRNSAAVPSGYVAVKASLESAYVPMGISCQDVGGLVSATETSGYVTGMGPCKDSTNNAVVSSSQNSSTAISIGPIAIALVVIVLFLAVFMTSTGFFCCWNHLPKSCHSAEASCVPSTARKSLIEDKEAGTV